MRLRKMCGAALLALSAIAAPAMAVPAALLNADAPGSLLVFPKFDIRGESETELRIVNTGPSTVDTKLYFVCPGIPGVNAFCAAMDAQLSFTPNQTRVIDVADFNPPCNQGYVVAYAVTPLVTPPGIPVGVSNPIIWDYLIGSYNIEKGRRHEADTAIALQAGGSVPENDRVGGLGFGLGYSSLPTTLRSDFRASDYECEDSEGSRMVLLTLNIQAGMQNPTAVAAVDFWNAAEVPHSSSLEFVCWTELALDEIDANFLADNLGTEVGSLKVTAIPNCPVPGGCPPLVPYYPSLLGAMEQFGPGTLAIQNMNYDLQFNGNPS